MMLWKLFAAAALIVGLALGACGGADGGGGICVSVYPNVTECFDCWKETDCTGSNRTWNAAYTSCPDAGYTSSTSNTCGYTH